MHFQGIEPTLIAFRVAEENPQTEVNGANPLSCLILKRARSTRNIGSLSGQIYTLHSSGDHQGGSMTIGTSELVA